MTHALVRFWSTGSLVLVSCLQAVSAQVVSVCPELVRVNFYDVGVPPYIQGDGLVLQDPPGHLVEWVRKAVQQSGCASRLVLNRRPIKRARQELQHGEADILATLPLSDEYLLQYAFPMYKGKPDVHRVLVSTDISLWVRKGSTAVQWDGHTLRGPPGLVVGAVVGSTAEALARSQGWNIETAPNAVLAVRKLLVDRMPVLAILDPSVEGSSPDALEQMVALEPPLQRSQLYSVASKPFQQRYPEFMEKYWSALCRVSRGEAALPQQKKLGLCR